VCGEAQQNAYERVNRWIMATRGRPAFQPTDEQRKNVEVMASLGIPEENIRLLVRNRSDTPISRNSLRKHSKKSWR
jgi:hypothetical protein